MAKSTRTSAAVPAEIVELADVTTLDDLCVACGVDAHWIADLVAHGVIAPAVTPGRTQHFAAATIVRVRKARRLERDFNLNVSGVALALDLLEEIDRLRTRIAVFERPRERD